MKHFSNYTYKELAGNKPEYQGRHREHYMDVGIGYIPLGNRSRAIFEFGDNVLEERDSVDIATSKRR